VLAFLAVVAMPARAQAPTPQEQRKLELEIDKLTRETAASAQIRAWLPAGTIVVGVIVAAFSMYQYFGDRRRESAIRLESQFAEHLGALSDYSDDANLASARVTWALDALAELTRLAQDTEVYRSRVTQVITTGVMDDANFEDRRHVRLDALCLERWPDYRLWLEEHAADRGYILYRYRQAVRVLAERHRDYFTAMDYGEDGYVVENYIEEADYLLFTSLARGYGRQIDSLEASERTAAVDAFGSALGNRALAQKVFSRPA
jgi:hypothetical protein